MNKLTTAATYFQINDTTFPKNVCTFSQRAEGGIVEVFHNNRLIASGVYTDWRNNTDTVYASHAALVTALQGALYAALV